MKFEIVPAHEISFAQHAELFNQAFANYVVPVPRMDANAIAQFFSLAIDIGYSRAVRGPSGTIAGFGYVNRTGEITRLAAMGTLPPARRTGAATFLLQSLVEDAKARGDKAIVLEVFEQNAPALGLYRQHGFGELTRLFGWRRQAGEHLAGESGGLTEISLLEASRFQSSWVYPRLPWQISQHAISKFVGAKAYRTNDACVVVSDPANDAVRLQALLWHGNDDWDAARNALAATIHLFPNCEFVARQVFPEDFSDKIFAPLGFERDPLNQILMRRNL